jgi:hypothetical protein
MIEAPLDIDSSQKEQHFEMGGDEGRRKAKLHDTGASQAEVNDGVPEAWY